MKNPYEVSEPTKFSFPQVMHAIAFSCILLNIVLSPWIFGSWEMWCFWPSVTFLFFGCFFAGVGSIFKLSSQRSFHETFAPEHFTMNTKLIIAAASTLPFLIYMLIRAQFPSGHERPLVAMDAERNILLFMTPLASMVVLYLTATRVRLKILFSTFLVNAAILALYAIIGQALTYGPDKPDYVLWIQTPWDYGDRAKGPFFCPNHLSAYMNLAICFTVGIFFTPFTRKWIRAALIPLFILFLIADFMTLSRGGLFALIVGLFFGIPFIAMRGYSLRTRLITSVIALIAIAGAITTVISTDNPLMTRVKGHPLYTTAVRQAQSPNRMKHMYNAFWYSFDRGTYIDSALRAWKSNPVWGIGPGQHSSRWAEFAATDVDKNGDPVVRPVNGNTSMMKQPRLTNNTYHLYEVHSDWTQLLEEYGIVGLILFLIPAFAIFFTTGFSQSEMIVHAIKAGEEDKLVTSDNTSKTNAGAEDSRRRSSHRHHRSRQGQSRNENLGKRSRLEYALPTASMLAMIMMAAHSLGDFSFQIPAVTWLFGVILTCGLLVSAKTE